MQGGCARFGALGEAQVLLTLAHQALSMPGSVVWLEVTLLVSL